MHSLKDLIDELIADTRDEFSYSDLLAGDKHKLAAAYILENEDIIFDIFSDVDKTVLAEHFAELATSVDDCDVFDMAFDIRKAIIASKDIEYLINTEIKVRQRNYECYHAADLMQESA